MTRDETKKILMVIDATYPNLKVDNLLETLEAWHFMLADYNYNDIAIALKTYVTTSGTAFPPSVSQLIDMTHKPKSLNQLSEVEAWALVSKAVRRSAYNAEEEFNKLPPVVQKAVGSPSMLHAWSQSDVNAFETVVASNFERTYKAVLKREEEIDRLPIEARTKLENLQRIALEEKK